MIEILEAFKRDTERREAKLRELEADGLRIIGGGQTSSYDDDGNASFNVTDWRTGEVLGSGHGSFADYDALLKNLDSTGAFFHIDHLDDDLTIDELAYPVRPTDGVPESLSDALIEWMDGKATNEEIAELVGWSTARVAEHRKGVLIRTWAGEAV